MALNPPTSRNNLFFTHFGPVLTLPIQFHATETLDFRSPAFCAVARYLVQSTGCTLLLCRQELFMAEGDAEQAHAALMACKLSTDHTPLLH